MAQSIVDLVSVRQVQQEDLQFILDSFTTCLIRYKESITLGQNQSYAHKLYEKMILNVLKNPNYSIFVACHKNDTNNIISYLIANPSQNHIFFGYTKYSYRLLGVQKNLLIPFLINEKEKVTIQFPTKFGLNLVKGGKCEIENKFLEDFLNEGN